MKTSQQLKFLFIVQGEGRGHATQAIRLKEILTEEGHIVGSVFLGTSPQRNVPLHILKEFRGEVKFFQSPNFIRSKNRRGILIFQSLIYNLFRSYLYLQSMLFIRKQINIEKPDAIINFYDLLGGLAWYFSERKSAYYAISHHFLFESPDFNAPGNFKLQKRLLKVHNGLTSLKSKNILALSFDHQPVFRKTMVMPPLIRKEILNKDPEIGNFVVVYLLNEGLAVDLLPIFKKHSEMEFRVYMQAGMNPEIFPRNVKLQDIQYEQFAKDLMHCIAVITSSGFETICEAAYLGKPVFILPSENHYEQHGNRGDAIRAGLAMDYRDFNLRQLNKKDNYLFRNWCQQSEQLFLKCFEMISNSDFPE